MEDSSQSEITKLLIAWNSGDEKALDKLMPLVYDHLHQIASKQLKREAGKDLMQTTALVHEAFLRLLDVHGVEWKNREHFYALVTRMMRQVLVDQARARHASKRGSGNQNIPIDETFDLSDAQAKEIIALNDALDLLGKVSPRQSKIVEFRFFGGLNTDEIGKILQISPRTVLGEWSVARAWLANEMKRNV